MRCARDCRARRDDIRSADGQSGSESVSKAHFVVALVSGQTEQVARVPQDDLQTEVRSVRPLRTLVNVDHRALRVIDERRCLDRSYISIASLEVTVRRLPAVEAGGVDGGVAQLVNQLRRESEQLSPDSHRCAVEGLGQRRWPDEFAASERERGSHSLDFFSPVENFAERRFHVNAEKLKDSVLPVGNSVTGRIIDLQ